MSDVVAQSSHAILTDDVLAENPMAKVGTPHSNAIYAERSLGFWFYLMSDAVVFAVLFANYVVLLPGVADGPKPSEVFELGRAAKETALLLTSSLTFGFLSINALTGRKSTAQIWLCITFLLGAAFLVLEMQEFADMIRKDAGPQRSGFLSGFFALVGTHGFHVLCGLVMLIVIGIQISIKGLTEPVLSRLYRVGLFWHFLDIVWVGIFSVVYLPGVIK